MKTFFSIWMSLVLSSITLLGQQDIISAESFMTLVKENPDLVILDVNKSKNYKKAHIKNAIHLNHNDLYKEGEIKGLIKSPEELAVIFGNLGIDENTQVVLTDDGSQKYNSRVYWVLQYLGHENALLLHKDKDLWRKARVPLTSAVGKIGDPKQFAVRLCPEYYVGIEKINEAMNNPSIVLVDARTMEEFIGDHKKSEGHIPQAVNLNYEDLLTETGAFKTAEEIQEIANKLGLTTDKEIIFYCRTSVRAGVPFYAFKNILGYKNVKVYDGAYLEWIAKFEVVQ